MKVLRISNQDGLLGCCTEKCYRAVTPTSECICVCGGANHGKGEQYALEHSPEHELKWKNSKVEVDPRAKQLFLWSTKSPSE